MTLVSRETEARLAIYETLLIEENERQNLVSRASLADLRTRHIEDSLQLLEHAPTNAAWLDIGTGPGLPGMVLAIAGVRHITLVEPRRLRTAFLERCVAELGLTNVTVVTGKVENITGKFGVITARAVASLDKIFALAERLIATDGQWVLPKGRSAAEELAEARATWQGSFRLEPSRTDPDARILVAEQVRRRAGRG